jgi:hypothetical protein
MYNAIIFTDITDNMMTSVPIGSYKLAHVLRKNGYSCLVVNHLSDFSLEEIFTLLDLAVNEETYLIGFSTTFLRNIQITRILGEPTPPYPDIRGHTVFPQGKEFETEFLNYIKKKNPKIKTIAGGSRVTVEYDNKNIDYVSVGYSEPAIINLMNHLAKDEELKSGYKNLWGCTVIDDRFAKSYKFADEDMQWLDTDVVNHKLLPIEVGRGCIFKCKFCNYPMNGKQQLDFVKRPELIRKELEDTYQKFGVRHFTIVDDTFNDHPEKLNALLDVVKSLSFKPIFWGYHRLDLLCTRPETVQVLYDIGVRGMYFGIETLNIKTGNIIGKGYDRQKQIAMIRHIRETYPDLSMHGSFIVGLPHESIDSCTQTFNEIIDGKIPVHSWMFYGLMLNNNRKFSFHSELSLNYQKYGYESTETNPDAVHFSWKNEHMTSDDAQRLANEFVRKSRETDTLLLSSESCMYLTNYGYDITTFRNTPWKNVPWNDIEYRVRPKFAQEYKDKLLDILKSKAYNN